MAMPVYTLMSQLIGNMQKCTHIFSQMTFFLSPLADYCHQPGWAGLLILFLAILWGTVFKKYFFAKKQNNFAKSFSKVKSLFL
jgi:hypothetical protein